MSADDQATAKLDGTCYRSQRIADDLSNKLCNTFIQ